MVADFDGKHGRSSSLVICNELAEYVVLLIENIGEALRKLTERHGGHQQGIEPSVV